MRSLLGLFAMCAMMGAMSGMGGYDSPRVRTNRYRPRRNTVIEPKFILESTDIPKGHMKQECVHEFIKGELRIPIRFEYTGGSVKSMMKRKALKIMEIQAWVNEQPIGSFV